MSGYTAFVDGSSRGNPGPAAIGVAVFKDDDPQMPVCEISRSIGTTTNNVAEYEAVIAAVKWFIDHGIKAGMIRMDSELVYKQLLGQYRVRTLHLVSLRRRVRDLLQQAGEIRIALIPREENKIADRLAQRASKVHKKAATDPV